MVETGVFTTSVYLFWGEHDYISTTRAEVEWTAGQSGTGVGKVDSSYVRGLEAFSDKNIVVLEGSPEFTLEKWGISTDPVYSGLSVSARGDSDDKLNNPIDVSIDGLDRVYVLDKLSGGQPRIKVFDSQLVSLGGIGNSTSIPGNPIACDCDRVNNRIHVLTSTGVYVLELSE